jgi:restriction endonuclease S subunit
VGKDLVAAKGEYNLSGERYSVATQMDHNFPMVPLGSVLQQLTQVVDPSAFVGSVRYIGLENVEPGTGKLVGSYFVENPSEIRSAKKPFVAGNILYGKLRPNLNKIMLAEFDGICSTDIFVLQPVDDLVIGRLYEHILRSKAFNSQVLLRLQGAQLPRVSWNAFSEIDIPLPPLEAQQKIVAEIEGYQKVIDGAQAVVENYHPQIAIDPSWPLVKLGEHFQTVSGGTPSKSEPSFWDGAIPWVSPKDMKTGLIVDTQDHISQIAVEKSTTKLLEAGTVVCVVRSGILKHTLPIAVVSRPMCINQDIIGFQPITGHIDSSFLFNVLNASSEIILSDGIKPGVTVQSVHNGYFKSFEVPMPPLDVQKDVVIAIEAEQQVVDGNKQLIKRMQLKIDAAIARIWGEPSDIAKEIKIGRSA